MNKLRYTTVAVMACLVFSSTAMASQYFFDTKEECDFFKAYMINVLKAKYTLSGDDQDFTVSCVNNTVKKKYVGTLAENKIIKTKKQFDQLDVTIGHADGSRVSCDPVKIAAKVLASKFSWCRQNYERLVNFQNSIYDRLVSKNVIKPAPITRGY